MMLLAIGLLGLITFLYRFSFLSDRGGQLSNRLPQEFLRLLAPATFAAIITNNIISHPENAQDLRNKTITAALSLVVAYATKNIIVTVIFGLAVLYALGFFFP